MNSAASNQNDQSSHPPQMKYQAKEPQRPAQMSDLWRGQAQQASNYNQQPSMNSQPYPSQYVAKQPVSHQSSYYPGAHQSSGNQNRGMPAPQPTAPVGSGLSMATPAFTPGGAPRNAAPAQPSFQPNQSSRLSATSTAFFKPQPPAQNVQQWSQPPAQPAQPVQPVQQV